LVIHHLRGPVGMPDHPNLTAAYYGLMEFLAGQWMHHMRMSCRSFLILRRLGCTPYIAGTVGELTTRNTVSRTSVVAGCTKRF
jgi:hypothetical protein